MEWVWKGNKIFQGDSGPAKYSDGEALSSISSSIHAVFSVSLKKRNYSIILLIDEKNKDLFLQRDKNNF
jgi:hypothetical protein